MPSATINEPYVLTDIAMTLQEVLDDARKDGHEAFKWGIASVAKELNAMMKAQVLDTSQALYIKSKLNLDY